jgi:protein-S-isoprenylcysteine O-methyltransferase Ste14
MDLKHRIERSFKPRFAVIYPFGLIFLIFGTLNDQSLRTGIGYIIAGFLIRLWSNGYAIKNDKLTTSGPYAHVRNPLYVGTFLIAIGFMFVLNLDINIGNVLKLAFLAGLVFMYVKTINDEQGMLKAKFGQAYDNYCTKIHAMIPSLTPYTEGEQWPFDMQRLIFSKEYKTIVWITVLLIAFHLKTRILIEHKAMTGRTWSLVVLAIVLIGIDIFYEMNKKKKK